jgi:hypothetical protein
MEDLEPVVPAGTQLLEPLAEATGSLPQLNAARSTSTSSRLSSASKGREWDDGLLLEHMKKPLVFEFNPLQV